MKRTLVRILLWLAFAAVLAAAAIAFVGATAGHWLEAPAQAPRRADAIVVLGGDEGDRAMRALELYREGYAPTLVLTGLEYGNAAPPAALTWRADFLEARGVPRLALRFEVDSKNSYTEAVNVLALMRQQGWRAVIVVSDPPHMRRLAWTWGRVFAGSGLDYVLVASKPEWWSPGDWWREERSGGFVIMEFIKLGYYVAKRP
jgi:uncharacterized SAM-binding protein YcdF (DUF218 family)